MSLTPAEIREILDVLEASEWDEATVTIGDVTIAVSRHSDLDHGATRDSSTVAAVTSTARPTPSSRASTQDEVVDSARAAESDVDGQVVSAPSVGIFWRAAEPGAPPFVEVGDLVEAGSPLCIVEVMKLFWRVTADVPGTIASIHANNGDFVQFGEPLFTIAPRDS